MAEQESQLIFSPDARRQLLQFKAFDQRRIVNVIREQFILADPKSETRNKFALDPPPNCADYELRIGDFRVLYRVEEEPESPMRVIVAVISKKERNKLIVEGEAFEL